MYSYLIGIITEINPSYIVLENNNIGYKINVANPYFFKEGIEYKIYSKTLSAQRMLEIVSAMEVVTMK